MKYQCTNCGAQTVRWEGKCSTCDAWGTLEELQEEVVTGSSGRVISAKPATTSTLKDIATDKSGKAGSVENNRIDTGIDELNRVLGGGLVKGEVVLISGEPGVGKSTLLIQLAMGLTTKDKVLYVAGEESALQLSSRAERVAATNIKNKANFENLIITTETDVDKVCALIEELMPTLVIVDSIQSVFTSEVKSYAGSISQVRVSGAKLTYTAKQSGVPIMIVGQINKEGMIAGPKVLEHAVDCVLYMEGDEFNLYRIVRGIKNRFGATNEIGVFEMRGDGMHEIANPSNIFIQDSDFVAGSAIGATLQGSRVVFVEVQALTAKRDSVGGPLKRVANGIKRPRLEMLCAVLSRRSKVFLGDKDVFVNIVGGLNIDDPGIDLAVAAAIKSSVEDKVLDPKCVYVGEVGLTGGIRSYFGIEGIVKDTSRLGYKEIVVGDKVNAKAKIKIRKVSNIDSL